MQVTEWIDFKWNVGFTPNVIDLFWLQMVDLKSLKDPQTVSSHEKDASSRQ